MKLTDKLIILMDERGLNKKQFSEQSKIPYMTIINFFEKGADNVKLSTLKKIASFFDVSLDYIADDNITERYTIKAAPEQTEDDQKYINKYMNLDTHGKAATKCIIDIETERIERDKAQRNETERTLPLFDLADNNEISDSSEVTDNIVQVDFGLSEQRASAGTGAFLDDENMTKIKVRGGAVPSTPCFGVPVAGDSMEPHYHDSDILIVSREPVNVDEIGIFTMDGMGYVKQLGSGFLHSLNPTYEDIQLTEEVICNGKVVGILDPEDVLDWG